MTTAFISHSSPDDRYVQEFVQLVRGLGYNDVFNDSHSIEPDELFWPRIEQGIREAEAFVVILSHASVKSYWVDREVLFAREQCKKVIPIRIDDCQLPTSFDGRDVIDLRPGRCDKVKIAGTQLAKHAPKKLFGREAELAALDAAWAKTLNRREQRKRRFERRSHFFSLFSPFPPVQFLPLKMERPAHALQVLAGERHDSRRHQRGHRGASHHGARAAGVDL